MANLNPDVFGDIIALLNAQEREWIETAATAAEMLKTATERLSQIQGARARLQEVQSDEPAETETKLAPAIRNVFRANGSRSYSATEMRDALLGAGYRTKHPNLLAAVHGVLKRMEESKNGDVRSKPRKDGTTAYVWAAATKPSAPPTSTNLATSFEAANAALSRFPLANVGAEIAKLGTFGEALKMLENPALKAAIDQYGRNADLLKNAGLFGASLTEGKEKK